MCSSIVGMKGLSFDEITQGRYNVLKNNALASVVIQVCLACVSLSRYQQEQIDMQLERITARKIINRMDAEQINYLKFMKYINETNEALGKFYVCLLKDRNKFNVL